MSTTVTYKGSTLTTVNNETKVLNTARTWLEGDITLTDETGGGGSTPEITISTSGAVSQALQPDTVYHFTSDALTSLAITFAGTATDQYHFDFISPSTAVMLSLPSTVIMPESFGVEVNTKYEIDIINNYGVYAEWVYEVTT